jgi:hypothetical protein
VTQVVLVNYAKPRVKASEAKEALNRPRAADDRKLTPGVTEPPVGAKQSMQAARVDELKAAQIKDQLLFRGRDLLELLLEYVQGGEVQLADQGQLGAAIGEPIALDKKRRTGR